ncbi:MAG TPA: hypothetical protein PKD90_07600, partial [Phnomibacter sp.]|nr:hypothetical protein [Phnomibacter sp.]
IMDALLKATLPLSWPFTTPLVGAFERLANTSNHTQLLQIIQAKKRAYWWHKHQGWVIAGVTVVLCLALYFLAA